MLNSTYTRTLKLDKKDSMYTMSTNSYTIFRGRMGGEYFCFIHYNWRKFINLVLWNLYKRNYFWNRLLEHFLWLSDPALKWMSIIIRNIRGMDKWILSFSAMSTNFTFIHRIYDISRYWLFCLRSTSMQNFLTDNLGLRNTSQVFI